MAKNRKQERGPKQPSTTERGTQARTTSMQEETEQRLSHVTPAEVAPKGRRKRFGHN
ncbi:hypothetical protein [Streptomyces sp. NPDC006368]|uniref:hypothetical protein n=1 Tax=Streptomyces sp. NPDC006368 TaxID=3156760 RepID=UPI0033AADFBE